MIGFTNPWLLWAFPVLLLPWIFRRRREERIQRVEFALLRFLRESEEKEFINPHLQELLLLILRTLLLALLLLALSGPKWVAEGRRGAGLLSYLPFARAFQTTALALDTSYSMGYGVGESSWWSRAHRTWNRIEGNLSSVATDRFAWDQSAIKPGKSGTLFPKSAAEMEAVFAATPKEPGASVGELISALRSAYPDHGNVILVTDGQRYPWKELLSSTPDTKSFPYLMAVTVGAEPVVNAWVEVETVSSPPWGISGWETIAGHVRSLRSTSDESNGTLSILRASDDKPFYARSVAYPALPNQVAALPFLFSARYTDFAPKAKETGAASDAGEFKFHVRLDPPDLLPIDNELTLEIPAIRNFTAAIAADPAAPPPELSVLQSALNPLAQTPDSPPVQIVYLSPPRITYPKGTDMAILANTLFPGWTPAETTASLEYIKNGGAVVVFTGAAGNRADAWNDFLRELGWSWLPTGDGGSEPKPHSDAGTRLLDQSLASWDEAMWKPWIPKAHGVAAGEHTRTLISYTVGEKTGSLIAETALGKGRAWLVNTALTAQTETLLSPVLPVFLWETAKETARAKADYTPALPVARDESDLTLLTAEEKNTLTQRYGIQFAAPEDLQKQLFKLYGGTDLRLLLILGCVALALLESWLSNRLASR